MPFQSKSIILAVACLVFLSMGMMTAAIGPNLPGLADNASTTLETVGSVFTGIFFGALIAQLFVGPLTDKLGQRRVIILGSVLLAAGTLLMTFSRQVSGLFAFAFLAGLGHGSVDLAGNVWIARVFKERGVSALNLLNFFFGLGGFAGPAIASLALGWWGSALPALWLSAGILGLAVPALFLTGEPAVGDTQNGQPTRPGKSLPAGRLYTSPYLWALGLIVLVYVGAENGMGGWTSAYMQSSSGLSAGQAAMVTSIFWLSLTAGRMVSSVLGLRFSPERLLSLHLIGALAGSLLFFFSSGNRILSTAAVGIIGFCFGPTYPTLMAIITRFFKENAGKAAGAAAAMGSLGGMLLPWLQGVILERLGTGASAGFTGGAALVMAALALALFTRPGASPAARRRTVRLEES